MSLNSSMDIDTTPWDVWLSLSFLCELSLGIISSVLSSEEKKKKCNSVIPATSI